MRMSSADETTGGAGRGLPPPAEVALQIRLRQQAAVAEFGRDALREGNFDALLQRAAALVAEGLGTKSSKVLELLPDGGKLLVRAGVGWKGGVVGHATIPAHVGSPAGYALHTGQPVVCEDIETERRFSVPRLLLEHGIVSAVNVIIRGQGEPFGVLEVDSPERRRFTAHDIHFLQGFANVLAAAIERGRADAALQKALEEKGLLLREMQHRTKNNIQVITSLLGLQAKRVADPEARRELEDVANRVRALGIVYEQLFRSGSATQVDLAGYLRELCDHLFRFHGVEPDGIRLTVEAADVTVGLATAVPLGLIVNELVWNSLEHAFPEGKGEVRVTLRGAEAGRASLVVADNGRGLPPPDARGEGLGLQLVDALTAQIEADVAVDTAAGTTFTITFPL
jgi:two-component sensor histidine kinase/putative methionine-R-sulfoxide reductase with GAF domain